MSLLFMLYPQGQAHGRHQGIVNYRHKMVVQEERLHMNCICKYIQRWLTEGVSLVGIFWSTCAFPILPGRCTAFVLGKQRLIFHDKG